MTLVFFLVYLLQQIDEGVKPHGHDAQKYDRHEQPIHFKEPGGDLDSLMPGSLIDRGFDILHRDKHCRIKGNTSVIY